MCYDVSRWCKICFQSFFFLIFLLYAQWVDESVIKFTTLRLTTLQVSFLLVIPSFPIWMHKMHKSASRWIALTIEMNVKSKISFVGVYAGWQTWRFYSFSCWQLFSKLFIFSESSHKFYWTPPTHQPPFMRRLPNNELLKLLSFVLFTFHFVLIKSQEIKLKLIFCLVPDCSRCHTHASPASNFQPKTFLVLIKRLRFAMAKPSST